MGKAMYPIDVKRWGKHPEDAFVSRCVFPLKT